MRAYDSHRVTLDPGLTALALRGLHEREGHYPFIERFRRRRRARRRLGKSAPAPGIRPRPAAEPEPAPSLWQAVLGLARRSSAA